MQPRTPNLLLHDSMVLRWPQDIQTHKELQLVQELEKDRPGLRIESWKCQRQFCPVCAYTVADGQAFVNSTLFHCQCDLEKWRFL